MPLAMAVSVEVPPLQTIVPAEAVTVRGQEGITVTDDVELLSAELSPAKLPLGPVHTPVGKFNCPRIVDGPPTVFPVIFIRIVLAVLTAIGSVLLQTVITDDVWAVIDQPAGNVCPLADTLTIPIGTVITALTLPAGMAETGPVFPMVISILIVPPTCTIPPFCASKFIYAFACPDAPETVNTPDNKRIINLNNFIFWINL